MSNTSTLLAKDLTPELLDSQVDHLFENFDGWTKRKEKNGTSLYTKKGVFGEITSVRYESIIKAPLHSIENFAFDEMLEHMPQWSKEFMNGEKLKVISENEQILKTQFKTPIIMKNREYVFYFAKIKTDESLKVFYRSVDDAEYTAVRKGFVRSTLYPTVYKFTKIDDQTTKIEHILSTYLGSDIPLWMQNSGAMAKGMVTANLRDSDSIKKVLEK